MLGAVLCVVGVGMLCPLDAEPLDVPGAVLCVVGVLCALGVEVCDDWDVVPVE